MPFVIPAAGVIVSFAGCVTSGSGLSLGFASARLTFAAGTPSTSTESICRSRWKSRLNRDRSCVACAVIVVFVPGAKRFDGGS